MHARPAGETSLTSTQSDPPVLHPRTRVLWRCRGVRQYAPRFQPPGSPAVRHVQREREGEGRSRAHHALRPDTPAVALHQLAASASCLASMRVASSYSRRRERHHANSSTTISVCWGDER